jgi:hypothetical protein
VNVEAVCEELGFTPGYLAQVLVRELAYQHQELAKQAMEEGPELGGFALQHLSNLLQLISELMTAESRRRPYDQEGGGGAKEATLAATPTSPHRSGQGGS